MLSIGKVGLSRNQQLYYEQQVARGAEDYYAGRGEAPGRWLGAGAELLGLEGDLDPDQLTALMDGKDPAGSAQLVTRSARSLTAAFDLTFSAPKSVSVLFAIGDDALAAELVDAHEAAVEAALGYLEREACRVRRGHGGMRKEAAEGFVAAAYRHRMSRAQDPQLHTHVVVANMARGRDGRWTALDGRPIYEHAKAAGYLYEAHLRQAVTQQLPWASWGPVREGIAELEQVPEAVRAEFSQRRRRILERERELEAAGVAVGPAGRERIVFDTREPKREVIEADWQAEVRARAAEHGLGREQLELLELLSARSEHSPGLPGTAVSEADLAERLFGPTGLTASRNTFTKRDIVIALAATFQDGASGEALSGMACRMLGHPEVVPLGSGIDVRYTTRELLRAEEVIVGHAKAGVGNGSAVLEERRLGVALETLSCQLTDEQAGVVAGIAVSGNRIDVVEALAGTGKTTSAAALREVYERAGYRVIGAAPTARAVRELKERAGIIQARTLDAWAIQLTSDPEALVRGGPRESREPRPVVLIIDEAGMANTRVSAQVIERAVAGEVKVVAIGDSGQLSSVQAGGWLGALSRQLGAFELREVMRQRDPAERQALAEVHRGKPESFLALKQERGDLQLYAGEQASADAERWLVGRWAAARIEFGDEEAVMICRDNRRRERLNVLARDRMRQEGKLGHETVLAGKQWAVGDRVIARRNDRARDLDNGMRGTITTLDDRHGATIRLDSGATRQLDPEYLARHVEHAYALTGHGMQGGTVQWAAVIGRPEDFSRNWAYTALSRAREPVELYLVDEPGRAEQDRREIAPDDQQQRASALERLGRRMRERDDEDLALERLEQEELETRQFVSPAREQIEPVKREICVVQEKLAALPIQEAKRLERIASRIAAIESAARRDRRPQGLRDLSAHRWRKHERERDFERLREEQGQGLERMPDPRAVLDREDELRRREGRLISEVVRLHEQAAADEVAARPPWLENTLGPEPSGWLDRERWQDTALSIGWHRVRDGITDPHIAIDEQTDDRSLTREIADTRVELGLDPPERGRDRDQGYGMEW